MRITRITVVTRIKIRDEQFVPYHWTHVRTYVVFPILNAHFTYRTMDAQIVSRELFWKLQGDILGSQA